MTLTRLKTAALENVIRIHGNSNEKPTEVIDVNIKTNLTVSNSPGSKFVQKSLFLLLLFFTGTFTILVFNLRRELQALKAQEQCIETKIAILMTKYEKVSNQLSRIRSRMNFNKYYQPITTSHDLLEQDGVIPALDYNNKKDTLDIYEKFNTAGLFILQDDEARAILNSESRSSETSDSYQRDNPNLNELQEYPIDTGTHDHETEDNGIRNGTNITTDKNYQLVEQTNTDAGLYRSSTQSNKTLNSTETSSNISLWTEPRTRRIRRDDDRRGPLVATFIGAVPEQHITDQGAIGPWIKLNKQTSHYDLQKFHLVENKKAIEITMTGLYMISTQIFYFGQYTSYSYWILLNSEGDSATQRITKCSAISSAAGGEVSCHSSVIIPLHRGDRLRIQQQERDRSVNLREGYSYIQLVLLSMEFERKQLQAV